jgi:CheY-like chemotaxis protein
MQFYVRDTGIGIPYDKQTEIFNRFTKLEMDKNRLYRGTGLGLTISKQVVELLGGKMWLKSQIGKGTIFYFTIPYIRVEGSGQNISYRKNMNLNFNWENFTILIAEDEIDNYEFLKETLAPSKIKILWAKDGKQALLLCRSEEPDLVLMDIKMPVMDGYETTKNIRKFSKNLPIIAQTAFALPMDKEKFADAEFNDYITKPVNRYILLEIIDKYISLKSESYN